VWADSEDVSKMIQDSFGPDPKFILRRRSGHRRMPKTLAQSEYCGIHLTSGDCVTIECLGYELVIPPKHLASVIDRLSEFVKVTQQ